MTDARIPWDEITEKLLSKYGGPAPRYTSYPTAPEWGEDFGPDAYRSALVKTDENPTAPLSLYVHIPYCKQRCLFCGCASWLMASKTDVNTYLDALEDEVDAVAASVPRRRMVRQLHWGGGTPTILDPPELERLQKILTSRFILTDGAEVAIEVNPSVTTFEQIDTLAGLGFNRISLGVQDFTSEVQVAVGRVQSVELTKDLFDKARNAGFTSINIDLMYGLPKQRLSTWQKNLETVIRIGPDRLAVFGYAHVPWMRPHQKQIREEELPDTEARFELFKLAHDMLVDAGFVYIGMDHFAKPEDELARALEERRLWRNFQGYTIQQAGALIGFGVTAISDTAGSFAQNQPVLDAYLEDVRKSRLATYRGVATSYEDQLRRHVITNLMCNLHLDIDDVEKCFDIDFWQTFSSEKIKLRELESDGLVELEDRIVRVTPKGRIFVRHVGMVFDTYTRSRPKGGPSFSKTV
ncbi:MAG: oxygen-independent coproporphyrinogen III oxidase [Proteobacteria bacterium]|nr:oxygen-independent coproporphyrinogen III oxidase [Pseudomonadota bacterium]